MRSEKRKIWLVALGVFVAVFFFTFLTQKYKGALDVDAASLDGFDAGYIISDYQMSNANSMNEGDIQAFLKSKNSCNDRDINKYTVGDKVGHFSETSPPRTWHVADGHFVCMADEVFNGGTAAHIIWQAAQDYGINPQVLLVLLEKEQSLVTDTFPHSQQYRSATGYGCPDTAACDSKYYGLNNQVRNAAALFRTVLDGGWTNYPLGENYVQYNPSASCGGSVVNIRNLATSALYRYTPYQPNAATLGGWYDGCNAYGNANFYSLFQSWFGGIKDERRKLTLGEILSTMSRVPNEENDLDFNYDTHIQDYGWIGGASGGAMSGTTGYSLRTEALKIQLANGLSGIEYQTHIQNKGWENGYKRDGEISGTVGESLRIEALKVRLVGDLAKQYDVYYRAHVEGIGWMDWVKNDEIAGTTGQSKRIEALQIKIVAKDLGVEYTVHVQDYGWMDTVKTGKLAGTTGESKRIEAIKFDLSDDKRALGALLYRVHVEGIGWMDWVSNGDLAGTTGQSKRVEAIEIKLSDGLADRFDIYYTAHVEGIGWMDWASNGDLAGTTGQAKRIEAIRVRLAEK